MLRKPAQLFKGVVPKLRIACSAFLDFLLKKQVKDIPLGKYIDNRFEIRPRQIPIPFLRS